MRRSSPASRDRVAAERLGRWAELCCVWRLRLAGYQVLSRRFRTPLGEIDIVARRGEVLVFVEVKARADTDAALFSVRERQLQRMARAGESFIARYPRFAMAARRYDIMVLGRGSWPTHVPDAWRPQPE